jgi:hypothetical protein
MKILHFLENDYPCPASEESILDGQRHLAYGGVNRADIEAMQVHYQFHLLSKDEIYEIIFNSANILVTYSMYIQGSDSTFLNLLVRADRNHISGMTYLDTSGQLVKFLEGNLRDNQQAGMLATAINSNNILTLVYEPTTMFKRIIVDFNSYTSCLSLVPTDVNKLIHGTHSN